MPSFEEILNRPASENKSPPALPVGTYHCLVDGIPEYGKSSQKLTDQYTFKFKILAPYKDVDEAAAAEQQVVGRFITEPYYITETAVWRVQELLRDHLGIDTENDTKPLKLQLAEAPGKQVLVTLKHEASQDGKRVFSRVNGTAHV